MGRAPALTLLSAALLAPFGAGCGEKPVDKAAQQKDVFAATDVSKLTPEQRAKVEGIMRANQTPR